MLCTSDCFRSAKYICLVRRTPASFSMALAALE